MGVHEMKKGVCIHCGCDAYAIDYFGWSCSGRSIRHVYHNGVCLNCGFGKQVIEHFNWPCRLDTQKGEGGASGKTRSADRQQSEKRASDRQSAEMPWEPFTFNRKQEPTYRRTYVSQYMDDETRYGRLLGLKGKVTRGEIKFAYREQANLYHPDRVAHLGPEFQELANEKMKEINQAFAYFQKKYDL